MGFVTNYCLHPGLQALLAFSSRREALTPIGAVEVLGDFDLITNYQLPKGPVKAGRRWGQRHPQGANLGSNGILNFLSKLKQWLPPAHPKSLASQCMSGQPISTCHALTS